MLYYTLSHILTANIKYFLIFRFFSLVGMAFFFMRFRSFVWLGTRSRAGRIWPGIYNRRNKFINRLKVCVCLQIYTQKSQPHQDSSVYVVKERCNAVIFAINSIFMRCLHMHRYNIQRIFSLLSLSVSSALSLALSLRGKQ